MIQGWAEAEVVVIVADYFVMLGLGQPRIEGYKPAANFQNALGDGVLHRLDTHPDWLRPTTRQPLSRLRETSLLWFGPRPTKDNTPSLVDEECIAAIGQKYDVSERDARNRSLGKAGEELIFDHECSVLRQSGREDLADPVGWISVQDGDGFDYDIASFEPNGREKLIEVKTTNGWERTPFHITRNEMAVADVRREEWHLFLLWILPVSQARSRCARRYPRISN